MLNFPNISRTDISALGRDLYTTLMHFFMIILSVIPLLWDIVMLWCLYELSATNVRVSDLDWNQLSCPGYEDQLLNTRVFHFSSTSVAFSHKTSGIRVAFFCQVLPSLWGRPAARSKGCRPQGRISTAHSWLELSSVSPERKVTQTIVQTSISPCRTVVFSLLYVFLSLGIMHSGTPV